MNMDLQQLYQETIVDHGRRPHNLGPLPDETHHAEGFNPLCGDRLVLHLRIVDDRIEAARFEGSGCAISMASASLMTDALRGLSSDQAGRMSTDFQAMLTAGTPAPDLGKLEVLAGVRNYPTRIKCATLAWHALRAALANAPQTVHTE